MNRENGEVLAFRDLPEADVYHVAHAENDIRDQAAEIMGKAAFSGEPDPIIDQAKQLIKNQNERDYEWLADQAAVRGAIPEIPIAENPDIWLRIHYKRTGVTNRKIAGELGVSEGQMSAFVKGRKQCPEEFHSKLTSIFSELPTKF